MTNEELLAIDIANQMNIDGLLARIHKLSITPPTNVVPVELATALIQVIKLHPPASPAFDDGFVTCETCNWEYDRNEPYPCPTIQAIEKELK